MPDKGHIPRRELGAALRGFFDHVASHDEEGFQAALCMVVNADDHVCNFGAGDPDTLARITVTAIDTMIEKVPGFPEAWRKALLAKSLQSMIDQVLDVVEQAKEQADEVKGMEAAKPEADALIAKLKGNPGAVPGPDTKQ